MAGFRPARTLYKLDFSRTELAGLEVTTRAVSVDGLTAIIDLAATMDAGDDAGVEDVAKVGELFGRFAAVLVSWNIEDDDGQPVPATREGLGTLYFPFVMTVIMAWITEMSQAPPPLPGSSGSGGSSAEASLGLASSSRSLGSSSGPG